MKRLDRTCLSASGDGVVSQAHLAVRLFLCALVLLVCFALFCGGTFAWFTDNASCKVEAIASTTWEPSEAASSDGEENADGLTMGDDGAAAPTSSVQSGQSAQGDGSSDGGSADSGASASPSGQAGDSSSTDSEPADGTGESQAAPSGDVSSQSLDGASSDVLTAA